MRLDFETGSVVYGRIKAITPGTGNASDKLTVVTLSEVNALGKESGQEIRLMCWNSDRSQWDKFSDKARKLMVGDMITAKVSFDIGDPNKAVVREMKKKGIYKCPDRTHKDKVVLCGKIAKTISGENHFGVYVPIERPVDGVFQTEWYLISYFGTAATRQSKYLAKGDMIYILGEKRCLTKDGRTLLQVIPEQTKSVANL